MALTFTTVDIALTPEGPIVFEVSAFGGYSGALKGCGIDAAALVADHVVAEVSAMKLSDDSDEQPRFEPLQAHAPFRRCAPGM